ncbi:hypothetical protein Q9L58_005030 [Maublancomyces gigas]|uniref:Uncharacterized protein n=1 Tax=Discina gigas TaxID=1032678 RepID=A0ABR3GJD7_9PEZI
MSGILRRSKSTRDAKAKVTRDQLDFNFATEIGPAAAAAAAAAAARKSPEPTTTATRLLGLTRRKSVSSFRQTVGIAQTADSHPKTADPRNRQSILYTEEPSLELPLPDRSESGMSNYGMDASHGTIGMAIGSPTEIVQPQSGTSENMGTPTSIVSEDAGTSSALKPPNQRFEVRVEGPVANNARRSTLHKEREREKENDKAKGKDLKNGRQQEELPKTGWRKVFGRGFFSKKAPPKQQLLQPEPATKKLELITRDGLSPHVVAKEGPKSKQLSGKESPNAAPCLNVDLPGVEMERYSVMFGTLLNPSDKSTIFARRKSRDVGAGSSKHQTVTGTEEKPSQLYLTPIKRHATTGQISRSPVSMLDVSPLPSASGTGRTLSPSGLSRSNTTIGESPSLSPQTMYMVRAHSRREELTDSASSITPSSSLRPRPSSKISKISEESSIDTPRGSFDDGDDEWMVGEDDGEPQWEMVTPGGKSPDEPMSEAQIETAAQISIARQISISRRQLLIPIVPRSQRLVSRAPIRKAMINPKFSAQQQQQPDQELEQVQEQEQEQEVQEQVQEQVQAQDVEPGLAR